MSVDTTAGQRKILLVEDDVAIREMYRLFLRGKGYAVETAGDGDEALTAARAFRPDLIFLDIMMPRRNGLEVLKILRSEPSYGCQNCKIVLLTNLGDSSIADHVQTMIDGYAVKAEINLDDLLGIIRSFGWS